jgi:hypothetical protein
MILLVCQILNPDPAAMSKLVSENASEEFLYSLSNYCSMQVRWHTLQKLHAQSSCFEKQKWILLL